MDKSLHKMPQMTSD